MFPNLRIRDCAYDDTRARAPAPHSQISNSSFIPSCDKRTCRGRVAFVAS